MEIQPINYKLAIHYVPDYRSPPSGLGEIIDGEHVTLITPYDFGPQSLEQAQQDYNDPPDDLILLNGHSDEDYEEVQEQLQQTLRERNVEYVIDRHLAYDYINLFHPEQDNFGIFELETWLELRA